MNTRTIAHTNRARWIVPALVIVGVLLVSALVALRLANQVERSDAPAAPAASIRIPESFAAFKQAQAMQVADAAMVLPVATVIVPESFAAMKQRQAMQVADAAMALPRTSAVMPESFAAFKQAQAMQVADAAMALP